MNNRTVHVGGVQQASIEQVRSFPGGATRDLDEHKLDFEGVLSPYVIECFAKYMNFHRDTAAGRRDSDNWQSGFPLSVLMKSMWRHFFSLWKWHRNASKGGEHPMVSACGVLFNLQCYMKVMIDDDPTLIDGMMTHLILEREARRIGRDSDD